MAENILYINERCHTGELREASQDLLDNQLRVVDLYEDALDKVNPAISPLPTRLLIRVSMSPQVIPDKLIGKWQKSSDWVTRMLVDTRALKYPAHASLRLSEMMESTTILPNKGEALGFLRLAKKRKSQLLVADPAKMGSVNYAKLAYMEDIALRRAVFEGVYLYKSA